MTTGAGPTLPQGPRPSGDRARAARTTMTALAGSHDVFETFFDTAGIGLGLADLSGQVVRVNRTYASLVGREPEDLVGARLCDVLRDPEGGVDADLEQLLGQRRDAVHAELAHLLPDGRLCWLLHGVVLVPATDGTPAWLAITAQDVTERRRAEQELRALTDVLAEQAVRDPLTGLANRPLLEERLRAALSRDARTGGSTAVLFLDLDGFKDVNDRHGHAVGDGVLRGVAERLRAQVRPADTVARLGGDEFVVLVEQAGDEALRALEPRLVAAVREPVTVRGMELSVGVSVGVAVATGGEPGPQALLDAADSRMYAAKRSAR